MFRIKILPAFCFVSVALLSACGGGSGQSEGGGVGVTPPTNPPVVPPVTTPVVPPVTTPVVPPVTTPVVPPVTTPVVPPVTTPVTPAPAWIAAIKSQSNQNLTLQVAGFGSSVGAGAALDDAAQAPVSYFASQLPKAFALANVKAVGDNRSVNGSILSQFLSDVPKGNWETYVSTGKKANVVLLAYGMNDGFPAIYNAAQPPYFFYSQLLAVVKLIKDSGAEPIIMTSPHPLSTAGWSMPPGIDQTYPSLVKAPVAPETMIPSASTSVVMQDPLGSGILIPVSQRHFEINKLMRQAAAESGASLIDVEKYWFEAVSARGERALYGTGETVHPNLLGHQLSYQKAIDDFLAKSAQYLK